MSKCSFNRSWINWKHQASTFFNALTPLQLLWLWTAISHDLLGQIAWFWSCSKALDV